MSELIPVTVLTGFLGSGKTTVLNHLLAQPGLSETAVIINEFGDIGLDHLLVRHVDEDIVLLNSGCLCCTVRGDMVNALRDLFIKRVKGDIPLFTRMVIETTGLADPAPIIHTLMTDPLLSSRYRLDGIVATIDAVNGMDSLNHHDEAVKQAAIADRLLITKTDLAADTTPLLARLRALNPAAGQIMAHHGQVDPDAILHAGLFNERDKTPDVRAWMKAEAYHDHGHDHHHHHDHDHHHDVNRHDSRIQAFTFSHEQPVSWPALAFALELMISQRGENLLRVKGLINAKGNDKPLVIHGVQHIFHPPVALDRWPDQDHQTRLVFITRDLQRQVIEHMLEGVLSLADEKGV